MVQFRQSAVLAWTLGLALSILSIGPVTVYSQNENEVGLKDNSFLIEEAYNQEQGVCQHIFNWAPAWEHGIDARRTFDFLFTQEWPIFSQKHQISYAIPISRYDEEPSGGGGAQAGGFGDIFLNYRYQVFNDEEGDFVAFAPRFSLILPSGDAEKGLGHGKLGYQVGFPLSKYTKHWGFNFNAGLTQVPGVTAGVDPNLAFEGRTLSGYYFGASAIYLVRPSFNLLLEQINVWNDDLSFEGDKHTEFVSLVLPGFRWAPFTKGDTQWVLGLGLPIGVSADAPDIGVFFYMSFEHRFLKKTE